MSMKHELRYSIRANYNVLNRSMECFLVREDHLGVMELAKIDWASVTEGTQWPEPSFSIRKPAMEDFLRQTVEEFAAQGVYLNQAAHSAEVAALKNHLQDMRTLVFAPPKGST